MPASPGFLFAHFQRFISPTPFNLGASIDYLFMVIIGGADSLWGAPLGAALVVVLRDQFNDWIPRITGRAGDFEALVFSLVVIVLLQRAPAGLLPLFARLWPPAGRDARRTRTGLGARSDAGTDRRRTARRPGTAGGWKTVSRATSPACAAVRDVSFAVHAAEIVALIGPNGAGKTTLFNLISGVLPPSCGPISLFGAPARSLPLRRIAALGIARTFQHVKLLPTAVGAGERRAWRASVGHGRPVARDAAARPRRGGALADRGAARRRYVSGSVAVLDMPAGDLPLGQQRVVEIARALCLRPRLLLLDEPAAGLRLPEKNRLAALLRQLRAEGMGVLLVEHDMDFVMRLADRVVVMDFGQKIAEGAPDRCRPIRRCMEAYLGGVA